MAMHIVDDQYFSIGAVNLTPWLKEVNVVEQAALLNNSTQGIRNQTRKRGKPHYMVDIVLFQDYAAAAVDATIEAVIVADPAEATMVVKSKTTGDNKVFTGVWTIGDYNSVPGGEGMAEISITIESAGAIVKS